MAIRLIKVGAAPNDGTGDDARTFCTIINQNFSDGNNAASHLVGTAPGNVMEVGAFGLGSDLTFVSEDSSAFAPASELRKAQFFGYGNNGAVGYGKGWGWNTGAKHHCVIGGFKTTQLYHVVVTDIDASPRQVSYNLIRTSQNTTVDGNGFLKNASPIVQLFADKIELNDEAKQQTITCEKLGVGDYLVKGSLGFAQEGWYIEMPKDANGNVLVAVVYEQLDNNDISVKTYDYMLNKKGRIVPDLETPLDIPATRWIDLRLQALPQPDVTITPTDTTNAE